MENSPWTTVFDYPSFFFFPTTLRIRVPGVTHCTSSSSAWLKLFQVSIYRIFCETRQPWEVQYRATYLRYCWYLEGYYCAPVIVPGWLGYCYFMIFVWMFESINHCSGIESWYITLYFGKVCVGIMASMWRKYTWLGIVGARSLVLYIDTSQRYKYHCLIPK